MPLFPLRYYAVAAKCRFRKLIAGFWRNMVQNQKSFDSQCFGSQSSYPINHKMNGVPARPAVIVLTKWTAHLRRREDFGNGGF
jgi:hypothetical protein